jgi:hypothetical protein
MTNMATTQVLMAATNRKGYRGEPGRPGSTLEVNLLNAPTSGTDWEDSSRYHRTAGIQGTFSYTNNGSKNGIVLAVSGNAFINSNYNLNLGFWTMEIVASFNPSAYWACPWANENLNNSSGYFAYFTDGSTLNVGTHNGVDTFSVTDTTDVNHWVFTLDSGAVKLYQNSNLITASNIAYAAPNSVGVDGLHFGARQQGTLDYCPGTYYEMRVYDYAISQEEVNNSFNSLKDNYGL